MTRSLSPPALRMVRLPGEFGPTLRCFGELSAATAEALRRELALLLPLGHPVLTLNLSGCSRVDVDGILTVLHASKELRRRGACLKLVAGTGSVARLLQFMGVARLLSVFADEEEALRSLRGEQPPELPVITWAAARDETVAHWKEFRHALEETTPEEALRHLTTMTPICDRVEALFQEQPTPDATARCQLCPLFYALGGGSEDLGCQSLLDPLLEAVASGDRNWARAQVAKLIELIEILPLPEETGKSKEFGNSKLLPASK